MIKGVYFDWGGVLIENPSIPLLEHIAAYFRVSKKEMRKLFDENSEIMEKYQKGIVSESDIWKQIFNKPDTSIWREAVQSTFKIHTDVVEFVELISTGFKIGVLSNTEHETTLEFKKLYGDTLFEYEIFSCDVASAKPEARIYEKAATLMNLNPDEILFIDDRIDFIEGATKCGMKTFHFKQLSDLNKLKNLECFNKI